MSLFYRFSLCVGSQSWNGTWLNVEASLANTFNGHFEAAANSQPTTRTCLTLPHPALALRGLCPEILLFSYAADYLWLRGDFVVKFVSDTVMSSNNDKMSLLYMEEFKILENSCQENKSPPARKMSWQWAVSCTLMFRSCGACHGPVTLTPSEERLSVSLPSLPSWQEAAPCCLGTAPCRRSMLSGRWCDQLNGPLSFLTCKWCWTKTR